MGVEVGAGVEFGSAFNQGYVDPLNSVRIFKPLLQVLAIILIVANLLAAQTAKKSALDKATLEAYVRHLVPYPAQVKIEVGDPAPSALAGFKQVRVMASVGERFKQHVFEVSADGQRFFEATVHDIGQNPFATDLAKLKTEFQPSLGTAGAPVTLVLFSDFQCSYCREQSRLLREHLLKEFPKDVRLYFKDYPLEQIHAKKASN